MSVFSCFVRKYVFVIAIVVMGGCMSASDDTEEVASSADAQHLEHLYLFHLIQTDLWQAAVDGDSI